MSEIIKGGLVVSPRPMPRQAYAASMLTIDIGGAFASGWWIVGEPELWIGHDVLVPDLAGWRRARLHKLPETAGFQLAPDWVCEVTSASSRALDRGDKMDVYARAGVSHCWIVDPRERTVEIYQLDGASGWSARPGLAPFEAVALDPSRWWAD
jgi:Uma2 family endonuclease